MNTEKVKVNSKESDVNEVLATIEKYTADLGLGKKDSLHVRLLVEETIGMLKNMAGDYDALLWIEKEDRECRVKFTAETDEMNYSTKKELLSVSKTGENALAKGFMGKIGDIIENGLLNYDEVMKLQQEYGSDPVSNFTFMGMNSSEMMMTWTLEQYRVSLDNSEDAEPSWDELERSIVASLAKDVIVGVKKDHVEMTIVLALAGK